MENVTANSAYACPKIPVEFRKEMAEKWLHALQNGKALTPRGTEWTAAELMMLAGVLRFAAVPLGTPIVPTSVECEEKSFDECDRGLAMGSIESVAGFHAELVGMVVDGVFDEYFDPVVIGEVLLLESQEIGVAVNSGERKSPRW